MSDLQPFPIAVFGGISQSRAEPEPTDYEDLDNVVVYRGRLAMRAPLETIATLTVPVGGLYSGTKQTSGATTYGYTDFSEFTVDVDPVGTGAGEIAVIASPGTETTTIKNDVTEGNYFKLTPASTAFHLYKINDLDNGLSGTEARGEMLGRFWIETAHADNRRIGGPAFKIDADAGVNADAVGANVLTKTSSDYEIQALILENDAASGGGTGSQDISEAEQDGAWIWIRFRCDHEGTTAGFSDYYAKAWYGDIADEPVAWDYTSIDGGEGPTGAGGVGMYFAAFQDTTKHTRCAYLSYTSDSSAVPLPTPDDTAVVGAVLDLVEHEGEIWTLSYSSTLQSVHLHSMDVAGTVVTHHGTVWSSVVTKPAAARLMSFAGGAADTLEPRLYIADYTQVNDTVYWDGTQIVTLAVDLNNDDTAEDVQFGNLGSYKYHLWGTGFYYGTTKRSEMIRFSQPGLIPSTDIAGGTPASKEWHFADHRSVGRRGYVITSLCTAGDRFLVFQRRSSHAIYGSGANTWAKQELSNTVGCIGPHASVAVEDTVCYFWGDDGPYRTDGTKIQFIGEPIRQLVTQLDANTNSVLAAYSPDDGLVHFILGVQSVTPGTFDYYYDLIFDHRREVWTRGSFSGTSEKIEFGCMTTANSGFPDGPAALPAGLVATSVAVLSGTQVDLAWTNGDTSLNVLTKIYRAAGATCVPDDATNLIATVSGGEISYTDTTVASRSQHTYAVRHVKYGQYSAADSSTVLTHCLAPTDVQLAAITNGISVTVTKAAGLADNVKIERKELYDPTWPTSAHHTELGDVEGSFTHNDTDSIICGDRYLYRVSIGDNGGVYPESATFWQYASQEACIEASTPPTPVWDTPPITDNSPNLILNWTRGVGSEEEKFNIYWSTDDVTFNYLDYVDAGILTYSHNLTYEGSGTYYYKLSAENSEGESALTTSKSKTIVIPE